MAKGQIKRKKTDRNVRKLEEALKGGNTRESACAYAWIWRTTFYQRLDDDDNFRTMVEDCEEYRIKIVEDQKKKLIEKGFRPAIEKELKSKRRDVYWDKIETKNETHLTGAMKLEQVQSLSDEDLLALTK